MAHSLDGLMKWLGRDEWRGLFEDLLEEHLKDACAVVDGGIDGLEALLGYDAASVLWGCAFEDFLTREDEDGLNIVVDYLKRRGFRETATSRAYMNALRDSVMSLYEVSDLRPGESFLVRDLIRGGEPVRVSERSGSRQLKQWDRIGARVVRLGPKHVMGGGVLVFDHDTADAIAEVIRKNSKALLKTVAGETRHPASLVAAAVALTDTEVLRDLSPVFTATWIRNRLDRILNPPQLINSDGDAILFTTARYPLKRGATLTAVRAILDALPGLRAEPSDFWNWVDHAGGRRRSRKKADAAPAKRIALSSTLDDGSKVLGTIEIDGRSIVLQTNSAQRAERGASLLDTALAGLIGIPDIETQSMEDVRTARPATDDAADGEDAEAAELALPGLSPEDQQKIMGEFVDRHYRSLLDEPIGALGGKTPRACARTQAGRRELAAWLKLLENAAAQSTANPLVAAYDLTWMWEELGVSDLRR